LGGAQAIRKKISEPVSCSRRPDESSAPRSKRPSAPVVDARTKSGIDSDDAARPTEIDTSGSGSPARETTRPATRCSDLALSSSITTPSRPAATARTTA
jgi:hypothetical protein